jgi:hypothetical protein
MGRNCLTSSDGSRVVHSSIQDAALNHEPPHGRLNSRRRSHCATVTSGSGSALSTPNRATNPSRRYSPNRHCHINRFYCSLLASPRDSDSIESKA